jgi:hypothetical protein
MEADIFGEDHITTYRREAFCIQSRSLDTLLIKLWFPVRIVE